MASTSIPAPTPSEKLRREGNKVYMQFADASLSRSFGPVLMKAKLDRANDLYHQAMDASTSSGERASCAKNLALLGYLYCQTHVEHKLIPVQKEEDLRDPHKAMITLKFYVSEAVRNFVSALRFGMNDTNANHPCKPKEWIDKLILSVTNFIKWISDTSLLLRFPHSPLLQYLCNALSDHLTSVIPQNRHLRQIEASLITRAFKNYSEALFKEALTKQLPDKSNIDYVACARLLHDCDVPLRKTSSYLPHLATTEDYKNLVEEVHMLEISVSIHHCICEGLRNIALGDKALSEALMDEEDLNMDMVKDSLDYYRQASIATHEKDMETEAIAMHRIGKIYGDVHKMAITAHKYHFLCVRLALTVMSPRIGQTNWYKYSLKKVQDHQERVAQEEKVEYAKSREHIVQRLKTEINKLSEEAKKSAESFLKFLYDEYPHPELKRNIIPKLDTKENVKQSLKKAILHYHPDKNGAYGENWIVLCDEICKHLSYKYECFK